MDTNFRWWVLLITTVLQYYEWMEPTGWGDQQLQESSHQVTEKTLKNTQTDHEDLDGEQRYRSTLSLTLALDGGGWSTPLLGRFTPGKDPTPIE